MMPDSEKRPVSVEDLLKVKRSERPQSDFWQDWQASTRVRLSAVSREPRPWWKDALPLCGIFIVRHQYLMGAGCVAALALTVLTSEPAAVAPMPGAAPVPVLQSDLSGHRAPQLAEQAAPRVLEAGAPHVRQASALITRMEPVGSPSPVDLLVAANLAEFEDSHLELVDLGEVFELPSLVPQEQSLQAQYHPVRPGYTPVLGEEYPVDMGRGFRLLTRQNETRSPGQPQRAGEESRGDRLSLRF